MDAGTRAALFREVNDRIYDLTERDGWDGDCEFLCECGGDCGSRVWLAPAVFEAIRRRGATIIAEECVHGSLAAVS